MSKRKLLLADDSITIQKVVNLTFADEDIEVITVGDGDAAMKKFAETAPDLVLADVNMPGLDGYQICETIKGDAATKNIPVILLVGSFEPFDEAKARQVGADDFLTKPFQSIRQLVNRVSDLLDANKTVEANAETVNSFDDTLEMEQPETDSSSAENYSDADEDDEMIQANRIETPAPDEAGRFESEPIYESSIEDIDLTSLKQPYDYESIKEFEQENDWAKTQPLSETDLDQISGASSETETISSAEKFVEPAYENVAADAPNEFNQTSPDVKTSSSFHFDDLDILELPQPKTKSFSYAASENKFDRQSEANKMSGEQTENLSPETIDEIADRVAEKILERVVERVAAQMKKKK